MSPHDQAVQVWFLRNTTKISRLRRCGYGSESPRSAIPYSPRFIRSFDLPHRLVVEFKSASEDKSNAMGMVQEIPLRVSRGAKYAVTLSPDRWPRTKMPRRVCERYGRPIDSSVAECKSPHGEFATSGPRARALSRLAISWFLFHPSGAPTGTILSSPNSRY